MLKCMKRMHKKRLIIYDGSSWVSGGSARVAVRSSSACTSRSCRFYRNCVASAMILSIVPPSHEMARKRRALYGRGTVAPAAGATNVDFSRLDSE